MDGLERRIEEMLARFEVLETEVRALRDRLDHGAGSGAPQGPPLPEATSQQRAATETGEPAAPQEAEPMPLGAVLRNLSLAGRTLVVLGGGYLVRALTDAGLVPAVAGVTFGLAYGAAWLLFAGSAARAGRTPSAVFHAIASVAIVSPLLVETTVRFAVLSPPVAAMCLAAFSVAAAVVADRARLGAVAWLGAASGVGTAAVLFVATHDLLPFASAALLMVAAVEVLAFRGRWLGLRWLVALALDAMVLAMAAIRLRAGGLPEGYAPLPAEAVVVVGAAAPLVYVCGTVARTLVRRDRVTVFEAVQTPVAFLVGVGTAARVLEAVEATTAFVAVLCLVLGAAAYAVSYALVGRDTEQATNFAFYSALACGLLLFGGYLVLPAAAFAVAAMGLTLAAAWLGARRGRFSLRAHAAVYAAAAAVAGGMAAGGADGLLADPTSSWRPVGLVCLLAAGTSVICYALLATRERAAEPARWSEIPETAVAAVMAWSAACLGSRALAALVASAPAAEADAGLVATLRTAVLSAIAVALATAARGEARRELRWIAYAVLAAGALKMGAEDFRVGRPVTLAVALALFGGALIATPRLLRARPAQT
jgi:hypothetical protein